MSSFGTPCFQMRNHLLVSLKMPSSWLISFAAFDSFWCLLVTVWLWCAWYDTLSLYQNLLSFLNMFIDIFHQFCQVFTHTFFKFMHCTPHPRRILSPLFQRLPLCITWYTWLCKYTDLWGSMGFSDSSVSKESASNEGDTSSILGWEKSAGEGIGYPLQYYWASFVAQLQCGRPGFNPWVEKITWRREQLPTPTFWPREFHGL